MGLANVQGAAHPNNLYCTTNIDLKAERQLTLGDVVTINDEFVKQFLSGKYTPYSSSLNLQSKGALEEALASLDHQTLLESFKQPSTQFYFTDASLGVSVEVAHALGHLEMEIGYETLAACSWLNRRFVNGAEIGQSNLSEYELHEYHVAYRAHTDAQQEASPPQV